MPVSIEGSVSIGWLHRRRNFVADESFYFDTDAHHRHFLENQDFTARTFPEYEINFFESNLVQTTAWRRDQVMVGALQPNLILAAALGAALRLPGDKDPDVDGPPLRSAGTDAAARLRGTDLRNAPLVRTFIEQIDAARARWGNSRPIIPPFFWDPSGRATIHGPLTTAQKLVGERLFTDMVDSPDAAGALLDAVTDAYIELCRLFAGRAGMAISEVHVGECSACMLGPAMFEEFVLPRIQRLADALGPCRMHSCGMSDRLLGSFAMIRGLACVNTGSGTAIRRMREIFGPEFRIEIAPLAHALSDGGPEAAARFVDQCIEENGEGPLKIVYHMEPGYPQANCAALHERLIDRGAIQRGRRHMAGEA